MKRKITGFLAVIFYYLLVIFISGELSSRFLFGHSDLDGNCYFGNYWLRPHHLPVHNVKSLNREGVKNYDPLLGWVPSPARSVDLYINDPNSIRVASQGDFYSFIPKPGVLRIALFGDSFTYGYEVTFKHTWGYQLENYLKEYGINAEVLNFGVPGYGMDQAFLRWKNEGYRYAPQIVIFGLFGDDLTRNVNLSPKMRQPWLASFLKPRFILENGRLKLLNSPTPSPEKTLEILRHFKSWRLSKYEYWYNPEEYKDNIWLKSRFLSLILFFFDRLRGKAPEGKEDLSLLGLKILNSFKADAESRGVRFYVIEFPSEGDLRSVLHGVKPEYFSFFKEAERIQPMIDPGPKLLEEARKTSLKSLFGQRHYSPEGNKIVADVVADSIIVDLQKLKMNGKEPHSLHFKTDQ